MRCPNKNKILLPYTLSYILKCGLEKNIVIIADSDEFLPIINDLHILDYYVEDRVDGSDEMLSIRNYLTDKDVHEFIWLPTTQPCRSNNLINEALSCDLSKYDLVTSFITRPRRDIFKLNDNKDGFMIGSIERKGSLCGDEFVADGAIYYTTKDFINKVCDSNNRNYYFWNSKIQFIENHSPLVDIDTKHDLEMFLNGYGKEKIVINRKQ